MNGEDRRSTSIEWLENLPAHWDDGTVGRDAWVRARLGWRGLTANEYVDSGVPMLATPDIKHPDIDYSSANRITRERYEQSPEIKLSDGDVLLTKDGSTIGTVNVVRDLPGEATVNGSIALLTPSPRVDGRFLYWYLASHHAQSIFDRLRSGMGVPHLFQRDINRIRYPSPPLPDQRAIADFLDRETAQIDTLIAEQQRLIGLLTERRAGVADQLVRTGVNLVPLKRLVNSITVGIVVTPARWYVDEGGVPALRGTNVLPGSIRTADLVRISAEGHAAHPKSALQSGDVVIVRTGQAGAAAVVPPEYDGANAIDLLIVKPGAAVDPAFLALYVNSPAAIRHFAQFSVGTIQGHFNVGSLRELLVPDLPRSKQAKIVQAWDIESTKIDRLIEEAKSLIATTLERRAALITAAVTGQMEIPS